MQSSGREERSVRKFGLTKAKRRLIAARNRVPYKRTPVRCTRCEARYTFSRAPELFVRPKRCACGNTKFYVDKWMLRRGTEQRCNCDGYWFPHRRKSKYCDHNPNVAEHSYQRWLDSLSPDERERELRRAA